MHKLATTIIQGDRSQGIVGTILDAPFTQAVQDELCNVVEYDGGTLDPLDRTQLLTKILSIIENSLAAHNALLVDYSASNASELTITNSLSVRLTVAQGTVKVGDKFIVQVDMTYGTKDATASSMLYRLYSSGLTAADVIFTDDNDRRDFYTDTIPASGADRQTLMAVGKVVSDGDFVIYLSIETFGGNFTIPAGNLKMHVYFLAKNP